MPGNGGQRQVVVPGPGATPVRGDARINKVLTAVRMFLVHAVVNKVVPATVLEQIYELGDDHDLPVAARSESGGMRYRLRAHHRLQEPETEVGRASDANAAGPAVSRTASPAPGPAAPTGSTRFAAGQTPCSPAWPVATPLLPALVCLEKRPGRARLRRRPEPRSAGWSCSPSPNSAWPHRSS